jgi:hypothetical protein
MSIIFCNFAGRIVCIVKILAIILAVMTWTVESKNVVKGSGEIPTGAAATYTCSYQKGTVRKGDVAVLQITGLQRETIQNVDVWVKSNKTAGAGVFTVSADGTEIASKSGSLKDWVGQYDNTNYHRVNLWSGSMTNKDEWIIDLSGTENSLYIDRYEITYQPTPRYTVRLMNGGTLMEEVTETQGGAGVLLAMLKDTAGWSFMGWCDHEFWYSQTMPDVALGGTRFYPDTDMTLWAMYVYEDGEKGAVTELSDGDYLYVNKTNQTALAGIPIDGEMEFASINAYDEQLYYTMVFTPNRDTAYVTHKQTNTPIGYNSQAKMAAVRSQWSVYHNGEQTVLYTTIGSKTYVLWLSVQDSYDVTYFYAGLYPTSNIASATMMQLLYPAGTEEPVYTCHPESGLGIELTDEGTNESGKEQVVQIGIYQLHIKNGKKYIKLSE